MYTSECVYRYTVELDHDGNLRVQAREGGGGRACVSGWVCVQWKSAQYQEPIFNLYVQLIAHQYSLRNGTKPPPYNLVCILLVNLPRVT